MLSLPIADNSHGFGNLDCNARPIPHDRVSALSVEGHDLDAAIDALGGADTHDELIVARLKKRRLQIRDEIASIVAAARMGNVGSPDDAIPLTEGDADTAAAGPHRTVVRVSTPAGHSFAFGVFVTLASLLMLGLIWSGMADSLNQTVAQLYLLSLVLAANG